MARIDWDRIQREKDAHRRQSALAPVAEKFVLLDRLRERDEPFRALRRAVAAPESSMVFVASNMVTDPHAYAQLQVGTLRLNKLGANDAFAYIVRQQNDPSAPQNDPISELRVVSHLGRLPNDLLKADER